MVIALDRAAAVRSVVTTTALRCQLSPAVTREVVQYAVQSLARGDTAHRAIKRGQWYARVRAGLAGWPRGAA